jgi:hypothetical protein
MFWYPSCVKSLGIRNVERGWDTKLYIDILHVRKVKELMSLLLCAM